jgi:hypothetical protein
MTAGIISPTFTDRERSAWGNLPRLSGDEINIDRIRFCYRSMELFVFLNVCASSIKVSWCKRQGTSENIACKKQFMLWKMPQKRKCVGACEGAVLNLTFLDNFSDRFF